MVVVAGLTVIEEVVCPPGDHAYVPPGSELDAVTVALLPEQIVVEVALTVGIGFTVTELVADAVQPLNVYVTE